MLNSPETLLLENLVAIALKRRFGDDFYFARDNAEVDFYVPKTQTLIQVAYSISANQTENREIESMLKIQERIKAENLLIITLDGEKTIEHKEKTIKCIPVWKWILL
ncbi:MAG: hypothetical protein LBH98_06805 [Chitinispirillales bacterium]|jgi:predicted AAA+ superfamily ATPase|nr:hypothetical protein [Chitinispirillales bacterium]